MSLTPFDTQYMSRALQLAQRGSWTTRPNPCVGCLIVDDCKRRVIAEAWHQRAGQPHAEINALQAAGVQARDKTLYVTLEPCSHRGRTGPCTQAIIAAGIKRVVYAMEDPNPRVNGAGLAQLRAAGIQVDGPLLASQARLLNRGFVQRMATKTPFVCCKLAMSIDGRTAMADGQSQWITSAEARADVQRLRAGSCAIMTGIGSILQDDSRLTVRLPELACLQHRQRADALPPPLRVVVDSALRMPIDAAIFDRAIAGDTGKVIVATSERSANSRAAARLALQRHGQVVIEACAVDSTGRVDLKALLRRLAVDYHCNQVLIEAGATLSGALLQQGLLDEIIIYMAPVLMGSHGRPLFDLPLSSMRQKRSLAVVDQRAIGRDWRITLCPQ